MIRLRQTAALLTMLLAPAVHAQAPPTAVDSMLARVGPIIDGEEKDYFGLFPDVTLSSFVDATIEPVAGGEVQVTIRTARQAEERRLDAQTAMLLSRYVAHYEALHAPNLPSHLSTVERRVELSGLARHQFGDRRIDVVSLPRTDGTMVRGWLLLADDTYAVLHDAEAPFDIAHLDERLTAVPLRDLDGTVVLLHGEVGALVEAGIGLGAQVLLASLAYAQGSDVSNPLTAGYTAGGTALIGGGLRLMRRTQINQAVGLPAPLLGARVAREVRAWRNALPALAPQARQSPSLSARARSRIHVMVSTAWQPGTSGAVPLDAEAVVARRRFDLETESAPEQVGGRFGVDVTLALSPRWHIGAEATIHQQTQSLDLPERSAEIGRTVTLDQLVERVSQRPGGALFGGVTLGNQRVGSLTGRIELGVGVAYRSAQVEGAFRATAAQPSPAPFRANTVLSYTHSASTFVPYARLAYDWYATPVTSLTLRATWAPGHELVVPEQRYRVESGFNTWDAARPEHRFTFSPLTLSFGLRTHV